MAKAKYEKRIEQAQSRLRDLSIREKEKLDYLESRVKMREDMVGEVKEILKEDIDQRKEISYLRKLDQQENLLRSKNFYVSFTHAA